jgi:hypothetical protein
MRGEMLTDEGSCAVCVLRGPDGCSVPEHSLPLEAATVARIRALMAQEWVYSICGDMFGRVDLVGHTPLNDAFGVRCKYPERG